MRALLARCPEWNDAAERARLATALEAEEALSGKCSGAAEVLRSHSCANMRKRTMLLLAHRWQYSCDCWTARVGRAPAAKRKLPSTPGAAGSAGGKLALTLALQQETPLRDRTFTVHQVAHGRVLELMTPYIASAARAWAGSHSAVQYQRARGQGMTWLRVRSIEGAAEASSWLAAVCRMRLETMHAWRDTLSSEQLSAAAYLTETAFATPESELEALRYCTGQARCSTYDVAAAQRCASPTGVLRPQDAAWVLDFDIGHDNALAMIGAAHGFVAKERMAPLRVYLEAAEAVLGGTTKYLEDTVEALRARLEWITEAAEAQGPAAGLRCEAQRLVPPMVQRLRLTEQYEEGAGRLALARVAPPRGTPPSRFTLFANTLM